MGPLHSGKSSFIKCIDNNAMNVEARGKDNKVYTVGMDLGTIKLNGFDISLFGTPGLLRFSVMRDVIAKGADGIIFIFDSLNPEKDKEAITILNSIRKMIKPNTPIVYVANKIDMEGARSLEVIKMQNNLPDDCQIFGTNAISGENCMDALKYVANECFENYKELINLMVDYERDIRGLAEKLKKNKVEMRELLYNLEIRKFIKLDRINKTYKVHEGLGHII